jgi:hypothetical protein
VVIEESVSVGGEGGAFRNFILIMEIFNTAKGTIGGLVPLLELGSVATCEESTYGEIEPIIVGVGAAFEHLFWSKRGGRSGGRVRVGSRETGGADEDEKQEGD